MALSTYSELPIPLWQDESGAIHVAKTRVTLDVIIAAYQHGDTPHEINRGYPTLKLAEIYAVLAYYVRNRALVDEYLRERDEESRFIHTEFEAEHPELFPKLMKWNMH
ncbi:MAG: DUF433 domain-containing protein [Chloroflexi bacterium]|nr:DUF433 domain-containing protein [Chloroflexota bacterium]